MSLEAQYEVRLDDLYREVIVDHRPGAGIRMAPHFYNSDADIDHALTTLAEITRTREAVR